MVKLTSFFNAVSDGSLELQGYFIYSGIIFAVLGLVWLMVRKVISNVIVRRSFSSLVFALAFAPSIVPVHSTGVLIPSVVSLLFGGFAIPSVLVFALGSILIVWIVLFGLRSLIAVIGGKAK